MCGMEQNGMEQHFWVASLAQAKFYQVVYLQATVTYENLLIKSLME